MINRENIDTTIEVLKKLKSRLNSLENFEIIIHELEKMKADANNHEPESFEYPVTYNEEYWEYIIGNAEIIFESDLLSAQNIKLENDALDNTMECTEEKNTWTQKHVSES